MNIKNLAAKFNKDKDLADYWAHLKPGNDLTADWAERWQKRAAFLEGISAQNRVAITLWNSYSNRFVFVSDKWEVFGGYSPEEYTGADGMAFWLSNIHPKHLEASLLTNEKGVDFFNRHPEIPMSSVLISVTQYLRKKNGQYFQMLQQSTIVEADEKRHPLLALSYVSDISHIKKPECADMVITAPGIIEMYGYDFQQKILHPQKPLSEKEKDILRLLSQGYNSKQIAAMLHSSPNTVDTHRRNIIKKTACLDTTGVVTYAKMTGMI